MTASAGCDVTIAGFVQGQGVRPALARLAAEQHWTGRVGNTPQGVRLSLSAVAIDDTELERRIRLAHPALSAAQITLRRCPMESVSGFVIDDSVIAGPPAVPVPRDVAVCSDCLREFRDETDRRYRHGLISCPQCGPRFSVTTAMPFDRPRTTLAAFPLCEACRHEYRDPADRRQHAQTIGCLNCGPQVWATDRDQRAIARHDDACRAAATVLLRGGIVAVRGVGGYQLLVDATNDAAVARLRQRKHRATKPFAVLVRTLAEAETLGRCDSAARGALVAAANPIVIVPRRFERPLAAGVHPQRTDIGLLLPTTAVHDRLLELVDRPVICTSGNREGEPLVVDVAAAHAELAGIADLWLHHDRPIQHSVDDSVVRIVAGRAMTLRLARGLAPLPLDVGSVPPRVALGGYQKSAVALSNGVQAVLGPHVGDLDNLGTRTRFGESLDALRRLYGIDPCEWIVDAHPDDAARLAMPADIRPRAVWHHHAHIVAGMVEHGWLDRPVLGFAADGQGYGPDGRLWGGEVLAATRQGFRRLATVRPFALPGGERATRDPRRVALSLLSQLDDVAPRPFVDSCGLETTELRHIHAAIRVSMTPWTSSLGRLFDGVACLVLGVDPGGEIGEAAIRLEALCDPHAGGCYDWTIDMTAEPWQLDWRPMLRALLADRRRDVPAGTIAERFHRSVAAWMLAMSRQWSAWPIVLGGGVFQNRRLCELLAEQWPADGPPLGLPGKIPCNDGGLAAGQLAIATAGFVPTPALRGIGLG
jgi:hydrogenase maturation protein HypF